MNFVLVCLIQPNETFLSSNSSSCSIVVVSISGNDMDQAYCLQTDKVNKHENDCVYLQQP